MRAKPELENASRSGNGKIVLLHFYKSRGRSVIIVGQFQSKPVGFMFQMTAERHIDWHVREGKNPDREDSQWQRGEISRDVESPGFLKSRNDGTSEQIRHVE